VHDVATLLKEFFRDLPEPIIPKDTHQALLAIQSEKRFYFLKTVWSNKLLTLSTYSVSIILFIFRTNKNILIY